jgi:16S rRNA pseudouridine516 synthase
LDKEEVNMRLDKLLANMGYGSRKEVKKWLKSGAVTVNGQVEKDGQTQVDPSRDHIQFQGETVVYRPYLYLMLNKPQGVVSARHDPLFPTVLDLIDPVYLSFELFPVGRLDKDTEGLLLLTNDGQLSHELLSPKRHVEKVYEVHLDAPLTEKELNDLRSGVRLDDGYLTRPAQVELIDPGVPAKVELVITEGKFHQVKRMFKAVGHQVIYLKRLRMGPLVLDERLQPGEYRELTEKELQRLGRGYGDDH